MDIPNDIAIQAKLPDHGSDPEMIRPLHDPNDNDNEPLEGCLSGEVAAELSEVGFQQWEHCFMPPCNQFCIGLGHSFLITRAALATSKK